MSNSPESTSASSGDAIVAGFYQAPRAAAATPATIRFASGGPLLECEGAPARPLPPIASISDPLGRLPRKIQFEDESLFEAPYDADLTALPGGRHRVFSAVARLEGHLPSIALACLATIALLVPTFLWGVPAAARGLAFMTPRSVMTTMDHHLRQTLDRTLFSSSRLPAKRQEALRSAFSDIARSARFDGEPTLLFRQGGSLGANAFALQGETVILTDELADLAKSDNEILGVLAHEIGHLQARHGLRMAYSALGIVAVSAALTGDPSSMIDFAISQGAAIGQLAYSREFEQEADRRGIEIMVAAGRDPLAYLDLLRRVDDGEGSTSILGTHPGFKDRDADSRAYARQLGWTAPDSR